MSRIKSLRDRHKGGRCVLVANGPSLNQMNLSFLKNEIVIGLNKIFLGFYKYGFYPKYFVSVNESVISQSVNEILNLNCVKFISSRSAGLIPEDALTYHINTTGPSSNFCHDISKGVHEGWTVTYVALQIAYYLGFSEVYLIGLDHRFEYSGKPNESQLVTGIDVNHFHPNYFSMGQYWDTPDLARSEESYRIAKEVYEKSGRKIFDATIDGACKIFEKVKFKPFI